jgi:hypothetical protein
MKRFRLPTLTSTLFLAAFLTACGNADDSTTTPTGSAGSTGTTTATLSSLQTTIFTPSCALSACHNSTDPQNGLDLSAGKSFKSMNEASPHAELKRIDTTTPENSLMYKVLLGDVAVASGDEVGKMPDGKAALSQDKIDAVKAWIAAGAKDD